MSKLKPASCCSRLPLRLATTLRRPEPALLVSSGGSSESAPQMSGLVQFDNVAKALGRLEFVRDDAVAGIGDVVPGVEVFVTSDVVSDGVGQGDEGGGFGQTRAEEEEAGEQVLVGPVGCVLHAQVGHDVVDPSGIGSGQVPGEAVELAAGIVEGRVVGVGPHKLPSNDGPVGGDLGVEEESLHHAVHLQVGVVIDVADPVVARRPGARGRLEELHRLHGASDAPRLWQVTKDQNVSVRLRLVPEALGEIRAGTRDVKGVVGLRVFFDLADVALSDHVPPFRRSAFRWTLDTKQYFSLNVVSTGLSLTNRNICKRVTDFDLWILACILARVLL